MNKKLELAFKKYEDEFNDQFPTIPLMDTHEDDELIEMIERCIKEGKDVYDIGILNEDAIY